MIQNSHTTGRQNLIRQKDLSYDIPTECNEFFQVKDFKCHDSTCRLLFYRLDQILGELLLWNRKNKRILFPLCDFYFIYSMSRCPWLKFSLKDRFEKIGVLTNTFNDVDLIQFFANNTFCNWSLQKCIKIDIP